MAKVGRPRLIESPDEMEDRADAFFAKCKAEDEPATITGLALALGLSSRESLDEYGRRDEFSDTVKRCKARVQAEYEKRLSGTACTGAIFALKNMGWRDQQDVKHAGEIGLREIRRTIVDPAE
jgi:hypothetical protein